MSFLSQRIYTLYVPPHMLFPEPSLLGMPQLLSRSLWRGGAQSASGRKVGRGRQCAPFFLPRTAPALGGAGEPASLRLRGGKPCSGVQVLGRLGTRDIPWPRRCSKRPGGVTRPCQGVPVGGASLPRPVSLSDRVSFPESCVSSQRGRSPQTSPDNGGSRR